MTYQYLAIAAAALSFILLIMWIWLFRRIQKSDRVRQEFFAGSPEGARKIDDVIVGHNQDIKRLSEQLEELGQFVSGLANSNRSNFQKIGFVRFNPFGDTGGSISFVLAILDANGNGFVVSSLHGREGNRVYAKEVQKGISPSQLTEEELKAIKEAK